MSEGDELRRPGEGDARLIARDDLLARLDHAARGKVTIISAPAGSGKTSLLRAWADRPGQPRRLAVLQVQRDQHDAQQFWLALLDAVRHASATTGRAEPPAATPDFNPPAMVDQVLSELADACGGITVVRALHLAGVWQIRSAPRTPGGDSVQARRMPAPSGRHW